jgi:formylglycine-generating enzyme required for sulfatase activity
LDDPSIIHPHSKVPDIWPSLKKISQYQDLVRKRLRDIYAKGKFSKRLSRVLLMSIQHEGMHLETMLYMIIQDPGHLHPPKGFHMPLLQNMEKKPLPTNEWISLEGGTIELGINDPESDDFMDGPSPKFLGWDNEKPAQDVTVLPFQIQHRPISIKEYLAFLSSQNFFKELVPSSWKNGDSLESFFVKTTFGNLPIDQCLHFPVYCSGVQAKAYASFNGLALPTEKQLKFLMKSNTSTFIDNYGLRSLLPRDVQHFNGKITDLIGNGW